MAGAYVGRLVAPLAMFVFTAALLGARLVAAPTANGFRHAIAAAPAGRLYIVDDSGRSYEARPDGGVTAGGTAATGALPLALAADGSNLLLGTDRGLRWSSDGGRTWRMVGPPGRYPAVSVTGEVGLAGAWGGSLELTEDGGSTWRELQTPGAHEYESIVDSDGEWYVATLTGVIVSLTHGASWLQAPLPASRPTAMRAAPEGVVVGTWRGELDRVQATGGVELANVHAGIWALTATLIATTDGLRGGLKGSPLEHAEVTALVESASEVYAGVARGPLYRSDDGGATWQRIQL